MRGRQRQWSEPSEELLEWEQVGAWRPCPCCGATAGCSLAPPAYVRCRRVCSDRPFLGGGGLHLSETAAAASPVEATRRAPSEEFALSLAGPPI